MSEARSALPGAGFTGVVRIEDAGLRGMVTIRCDLADTAVTEVIGEAAGMPVPGKRRIESGEGGALIWMSPDELLMLCPHDEAEARTTALAAALAGRHHLVVNVSDARAVFRIAGEDRPVREVLAKLAPADLRPSALPHGEVRRTRLAQVPAAFWLDGEDGATVICFRSVARYVFDLLCHAAAPGSEVGHF